MRSFGKIFNDTVNDIGMFDTLQKFKIPLNVVIKILKPNNGKYFSCDQLNGFFYYYMFYDKKIPTRLTYNNFTIHNERDDTDDLLWRTGIVVNESDKNKRVYVEGFIQPFYWNYKDNFEREEKQLLYVGLDWFQAGDLSDSNDDYIEIDDVRVYRSFPMEKFTSMNDVMDYYINVYPQECVKYTLEYIELIKNKYPKIKI